MEVFIAIASAVVLGTATLSSERESGVRTTKVRRFSSCSFRGGVRVGAAAVSGSPVEEEEEEEEEASPQALASSSTPPSGAVSCLRENTNCGGRGRAG